METRRQGTTLFSAMVVLIGTLLVIQLFLVAASVEALLGGDAAVLGPSAGASVVLFAADAGLLGYVVAFDRRLRRSGHE